MTPGRFKLYTEFVSGEQVLVVDVKPELDPEPQDQFDWRILPLGRHWLPQCAGDEV